MKLIPIVSIILVSVVLTASNCRKKNPEKPIDKLPPETQTGANTFGCLIDGEAFIPKGNPLSGPILKAQYQFVNGKQSFGISARNSEGEMGRTIAIGGDSIILNLGEYDLNSRNIAGQLHGRYIFSMIGTLGNYYYTNEIQKGLLIIKNFDSINQIVSGSFWFDALDSSTGKIIEVREGRFDLPYVR